MGGQKCCGQESCTENDRPPQNDRRCQLINEIKGIIGNIEQGDKVKPRESRRPDRAIPGMRDLEDECRQWRKRRECSPPLITAIALHEIRPSGDYSNTKYESRSQVTYVDATIEKGQGWRKVPPAPWDLPRTPSQELRAGNLFLNCQCLKRNGLQYDCPRWECGGRPECVAVNPGPCCLPSQSPKPIRGDRRYSNNADQKGASTAGTPGFKGKQLKTGPLNYDICIPKNPSSQGVQGAPGGAGPGMTGFSESGPSKQTNQISHPQGKGVTDVIMVLDMSQIGPGAQRSQQNAPQSQGPTQAITLTGPGMTCCCRPIQSAPAPGGPGMIGVPVVASSPM